MPGPRCDPFFRIFHCEFCGSRISLGPPLLSIETFDLEADIAAVVVDFNQDAYLPYNQNIQYSACRHFCAFFDIG